MGNKNTAEASSSKSQNGVIMTTGDGDWSKPAMMAVPKEGYFELERGRYGPIFPRTPGLLRVHDHRKGHTRPRGSYP
jgi:hypothetical protein